MGRTSVPWDVPVMLLPGSAADLEDVVVRQVAAGVALPGVRGLRVTTGRLGGRVVLAGVEPVPRLGAGESAGGSGASAGGVGESLATVVADLGPPVPVLAVGTPLQRRVLAVLAEVPVGEAVSYGELAARAGAPGAARAVARVMATNRVPLLLPCHRVVPASGGIGRYGWGSGVKAALLALEGAEVPARRAAGGRSA